MKPTPRSKPTDERGRSEEKLAALRTASYFQARAARADLAAFDRILKTAGDEPPRPGDEILPD